MNWYKYAQTVIAYHGTYHNFDKFILNHGVEGHDAEGPGIYFTSDPKDAEWYTRG